MQQRTSPPFPSAYSRLCGIDTKALMLPQAYPHGGCLCESRGFWLFSAYEKNTTILQQRHSNSTEEQDKMSGVPKPAHRSSYKNRIYLSHNLLGHGLAAFHQVDALGRVSNLAALQVEVKGSTLICSIQAVGKHIVNTGTAVSLDTDFIEP